MDFQTPYGGRNRMQFTKSEYAKGILGTILLLVPVVGYVFEFKHFSNTFGIESLIVRALVFGFVMGLLGGFYFSKNLKDGLEKLQMYVAFVFLGLLVIPLLASWINRALSSNQLVYETVVLERQQVYSQSRFGQVEGKLQTDGYYVFFIKDRKLERIKTSKLLFPKDTPKGTRVDLPIRKGGLGYDYFVEIILKESR